MKSLILLVVLATSIVSTVKSEQQWRLHLLNPIGFKFCLEPLPGYGAVSIAGGFFAKPYGDEPNGEFQGEMDTSTGGWWVYRNLTAPLSPGDKFFFVIGNRFNASTTPEVDDLMAEDEYIVPENATRVDV